MSYILGCDDYFKPFEPYGISSENKKTPESKNSINQKRNIILVIFPMSLTQSN